MPDAAFDLDELAVSDDRARCAHHEAGHVAAYRHLRWPVRLVEVYHDGTGLCRGLERTDQPLRKAIVCLAGPVAEANFAGIPVDDLLVDPAVGTVDHDMARRCLAGMDDPEERLRLLVIAAERLVRQRWPSIERIAEALLARGRLDAREPETLFRA